MAKKDHSKAEHVKVPEIELVYNRKQMIDFPGNITSSEDAEKVLRSIFKEGEIELHEVFLVLYFDRANHPIGYYRHSVGGIHGTVADVRILLGAALKSLSSSMIICHNHPSGNLAPSDADVKLTNQIIKAAKVHNISVLDHIILTKGKYASMNDKGLMGVGSPYPIIPENIELATEEEADRYRLEMEGKALQLELELLKL